MVIRHQHEHSQLFNVIHCDQTQCKHGELNESASQNRSCYVNDVRHLVQSSYSTTHVMRWRVRSDFNLLCLKSKKWNPIYI